MAGEKRESFTFVAPMSLPGGYVFDATIDGKTIQITIPEGGVNEGDVLEVPVSVIISGDAVVAHVSMDDSEAGSEMLRKKFLSDADIIPEGVWRHSFCSCFDVIGQPSYLLAILFPWVLLGQLMQRLKLNFWGCRTENHKHTCILVFLFGILTLSIEIVLFLLFLFTGNPINFTLASAVLLYTSISFLYYTIMLRRTLRNGFSLPSTIICNDSPFDPCDDFFTSLCCCCWCSLMQMSRHTHNEQNFEYIFVSETGLSEDASEIYYRQ